MANPAVDTKIPSSHVNDQVVSGTDANGRAVFTPGSAGYSGVGTDGKTYGPIVTAPNFPPIPHRGRRH